MSILQGIEIPLNSRFSVHPNANSAPGTCCVCTSPGGDGRQFIDFGMQLDVYGAVYFCTYCVSELCSAAGFVHSSRLIDVEQRLSKLQNELNVIEQSFRDYRDVTRGILRDCTCRGDDSGTVVHPTPGPKSSSRS